MHSTYHKEYSARQLYYILIGATHYLESAGMKLDSNEVNKNPKELEVCREMGSKGSRTTNLGTDEQEPDMRL